MFNTYPETNDLSHAQIAEILSDEVYKTVLRHFCAREAELSRKDFDDILYNEISHLSNEEVAELKASKDMLVDFCVNGILYFEEGLQAV